MFSHSLAHFVDLLKYSLTKIANASINNNFTKMKGNNNPFPVIAVQNFSEPVVSSARIEADKVIPMSANVAEISNATPIIVLFIMFLQYMFYK